MIPLAKLAKLPPRTRSRKAALVLGEIERRLLSHPEPEDASRFRAYAADLAALVAGDLEAAAAKAAAEVLRGNATTPELFLRALDALRHALLAQTGQAPADWDLIDPTTGRPERGARRIMAGMRAYLEDLRSPFNVGTVFRTAEAFGLEELVLSPDCADPLHPRAQRSAMGAVDLVPWRRQDLSYLVGDGGAASGPVFASELGGTPIGEFDFPPSGIVVIGSEELGVSPEARKLCDGGVVSIPMYGAKGSLNVAVAFGILAYAWAERINDRRGSP